MTRLEAYRIVLDATIAQDAQSFDAHGFDSAIKEDGALPAATGVSRRRLEYVIREAGRVPTIRRAL